MSRQVCIVEPRCSLDEARALLKRRRIRQLPVVQEGRLVGIVTDRDLRGAAAKAVAVAEVMTKKPVTIHPDAALDEAARSLRTRKINALPVVEGGDLAGILTVSDVLDAFVDLSGVAEPSYRVALSRSGRKHAEAEIADIVRRQRGELLWVHRDERQRGRIHVRLKTRDIDGVVTALEAAGFEVSTVVAPGTSRQ